MTMRRCLLMMVILLVSVARAQASIIVSFGTSAPDPITAGASGLIDVFLKTDAGTQLLDGFNVQVGITGGPAGGLLFSGTQTETQLADTSYVFFNKSLSQNTQTSIGAVSGGGSLYTGFDATDDGTGPPPAFGNPDPITLTTTNQLLYRLNLSAVTAGLYTINVNALADPSFFTNQLDAANTGITFSSTGGSITVNSAAVPEPSSIAILCIAGAGAGVVRLRRKLFPKRVV